MHMLHCLDDGDSDHNKTMPTWTPIDIKTLGGPFAVLEVSQRYGTTADKDQYGRSVDRKPISVQEKTWWIGTTT